MNYCLSATAYNVIYQINKNGEQQSIPVIQKHTFKIECTLHALCILENSQLKLLCCIQWCDNSS